MSEDRYERMVARLRDKEHRDAFVEAEYEIGLAAQIRMMRMQRGWTLPELADRAGLRVSVLARLENPNLRGGYRLPVLARLAAAFDVALAVRFEPFTAAIRRAASLSHDEMAVPSFDKEYPRM